LDPDLDIFLQSLLKMSYQVVIVLAVNVLS
jgi:hypothetical protein